MKKMLMHALVFLVAFSMLSMLQVRAPLVGDIAEPYGTVDINDVVAWGTAFGAKEGEPQWKPEADLDPNGVIDIFDGIIISQHFGETGDP